MFRFLWHFLDEKKSPVIQELTRLMFGMNASPFEMQYVVRHNAEKNQSEYPLAAETILESAYMDDTMDSTQTEDNAIYLYEELKKSWKLYMWYETSYVVVKLEKSVRSNTH